MKMMLKQKNTRNRKNTGFSRAVGEQVKSQSMEPVRESESVEQLKKKKKKNETKTFPNRSLSDFP